MAEWDFILAPATVAIEFRVDEVGTLTNSLRLLNAANYHSGLGAWVAETASQLTPEEAKINMMICDTIDHLQAVVKASTFPELIKGIATVDPIKFVDATLDYLRNQEGYPGDDVLLASEESFVQGVQALIGEKYEKKGEAFDGRYWHDLYPMLINPKTFRDQTNSHLQMMWDRFVRDEWRRVKPILQEAYEAFSQMNYLGMTGFEAIEAVTGRNMRGSEFLEESLNRVDKIVFIPSAHLGPYIGWSHNDDNERELRLYFGARLPKNAKVKSLALSRSELLVRLNALADETRLKMLELLTENHEMCAQDFITALDLSQSSASRHLRQLTASGYIAERRRDVAKCYTLNPDRVEDTIRALKDFLRK